ncbi:hypothetical protein [Streptosporangium sp. NPDC002524]|uniref:hypothetical protein n=1 Tax=Streptosporangium sp. NPDC002524 TaxID=3154537 RepID=UPI003328394D
MGLHVVQRPNGALELDVRDLDFLPFINPTVEYQAYGRQLLNADIPFTKLTVINLEKLMADYPQHTRLRDGNATLDAAYRLIKLDDEISQLRKTNDTLRASLAQARAADNGLKTRIENRVVKARKLLTRLTEANDYTAMAVVSARLRELESLL